MCEIFDKISHRRRATSSDGFRIFPQNKEAVRPELPWMASLKNVHPCTFFSFEFSWWKTRYCLEPLTSCQYSDVLCVHKTRHQCAQGWAWNRSETSFGTKLVLNRCTWTYIGWEVHGCTAVEDGSNGLTVSIFPRFISTLPDAFTLLTEKKSLP